MFPKVFSISMLLDDQCLRKTYVKYIILYRSLLAGTFKPDGASLTIKKMAHATHPPRALS